MKYVGIRNSPEKAALLERGEGQKGVLPTDELAYDCIRHFDFLRTAAEAGEEAFPETLYWKYFLLTGRGPEAARARCRSFKRLYMRIRAEGYDDGTDPIAVTEDGIRLNGSHRAAIGAFLDLPPLPVRVYRWKDVLPARRVRHVRAEADVKREGQTRYVGRSAYDAGHGDRLGTIAFVDARPTGLGRRLRGELMELMLALEDEDGELALRPAKAVTLR